MKTLAMTIAAGAVLAVLAGCIGRGPAPVPVREPIPADVGTRVREFVDHGFAFPFGKTVAEIQKNRGRPQRFDDEAVPNLHYPDRTDHLYRLGYPGLDATVYRVTEDKKEIITEVTVTSSRYRLRWGLGVGTPLADVKELLGPPTEEHSGVATWVAGEEAPSSVSFYFRNGTVYKVAWNFYVD